MNMEPPSWPAHFSRLRQYFWLFFLLTIAYMIWVRNYLSPLASDDIVQFEIAKTADRAQGIIADWKNTDKSTKAANNTGNDLYFKFSTFRSGIGSTCR